MIATYNPKSRNRRDRMALKAGMNQFVWDMRYADAETFPGLIMWAGNTSGPKAVPGQYQARLITGSDSVTVDFEILQDPRSTSSRQDIQAQFEFLVGIRDKLTETHQAIKQIRDARAQVNSVSKRLKGVADADTIKKASKALLAKIKEVEEALYQTKNQSGQDPLNFPIRLNNKLAAVSGVAARGDFRPTDSMVAVRDELTQQINAQLETLRQVMATDLPAFNALVREANIPAVYIETEEQAGSDDGGE